MIPTRRCASRARARRAEAAGRRRPVEHQRPTAHRRAIPAVSFRSATVDPLRLHPSDDPAKRATRRGTSSVRSSASRRTRRSASRGSATTASSKSSRASLDPRPFGGAVPYLFERLDNGWRDFAECRRKIDELPSVYSPAVLDTVVQHAVARARAQQSGADHLVMGSDTRISRIHRAERLRASRRWHSEAQGRIFSGDARTILRACSPWIARRSVSKTNVTTSARRPESGAPGDGAAPTNRPRTSHRSPGRQRDRSHQLTRSDPVTTQRSGVCRVTLPLWHV